MNCKMRAISRQEFRARGFQKTTTVLRYRGSFARLPRIFSLSRFEFAVDRAAVAAHFRSIGEAPPVDGGLKNLRYQGIAPAKLAARRTCAARRYLFTFVRVFLH